MAGKGTKNNQQNTQGDAQTEQAVQTKPLDFDVRIHSIKPNESIKGTASVNINGAFAIRGVKIIEGSIVTRVSRFVNEFHILKATFKFCTRLSTFVMTFPFFSLLL